MINPASLIGAVVGFFIGFWVFRSSLLMLILAVVGSSVGSMLGGKGRERADSEGGFRWFGGWNLGGSADGSVFMETLFSMLGILSAADGHVSQIEEDSFRKIVVNDLGIRSPQSLSAALEIFRRAASSGQPMSAYARSAVGAFSNRPQLLELLMIMLVRVAAADNDISPEEDGLLRETAGIFGYTNQKYEFIRNNYGTQSEYGRQSAQGSGNSNNLSSAYETLGVTSSASNVEIRRAYRKLASEYHPDKIEAKGLPSEFTDFAKTKFQEIQQAWDEIRKARGV